MNFLAHLLLAGDSDQALVGNLLGDFVKGRLAPGRWPPDIARGIRLHRLVDSFTDAHPRVVQSKTRLSAERRRYAGIIVDVCYDHFLARHWSRFSDDSLAAFSARSYAALRRHHALLPERLQRIAPLMEADDWLGSYRQFDNAVLALDRISLRLRRPNRLGGAGADISRVYADLEADFLGFFPELIRYAHEQRRALDDWQPD